MINLIQVEQGHGMLGKVENRAQGSNGGLVIKAFGLQHWGSWFRSRARMHGVYMFSPVLT